MARNLRKSYYSTLGVPVVEIKNSTEALLNDDVRDVAKISKLCLRFRIPAAYRPLIWQILLGIMPRHRRNQEFVREQLQLQYNDWKLAYSLLSDTDVAEEKNAAADPLHVAAVAERMVGMCSLATSVGRVHPKKWKLIVGDESFQAIAAACYSILQNEMDAFWVFLKFTKSQSLIAADPDDMAAAPVYKRINTLSRLLQVNDRDLFGHFNRHSVSIDVFGYRWMKGCFADCVDIEKLERIWDILISGPPGMVVYIALSLLISVRKELLEQRSSQEIQNRLQELLPSLNIDSVVQGAIGLSQKPTNKIEN